MILMIVKMKTGMNSNETKLEKKKLQTKLKKVTNKLLISKKSKTKTKIMMKIKKKKWS